MAWSHSDLKGLQEVRNLKSVRERRGKTLRELSAETGASLSTLSQLENGRRRARPETVTRIADALDVPNRELLRADWDSLSPEQQKAARQWWLEVNEAAYFVPDRTLRLTTWMLLCEMLHRGIRWPSVDEMKADDEGTQESLFEHSTP